MQRQGEHRARLPKGFLLAGCLFCFLRPAEARATNGMDRIGFGARSAAMGGVSIGVEDGAASLIRNPG